MMSVLERLIEKSKSSDYETASSAVTDLGLLLERLSLHRQGNPAFDEMYASLLGDLANYNISTLESCTITERLRDILHSEPLLAIDAAHALGRTSDLEVSVELIKCLAQWATNSDELNMAVLSALSAEHGFPFGGHYRWNQLIGLTKLLAKVGGPKVKEAAQSLILDYPDQFEE